MPASFLLIALLGAVGQAGPIRPARMALLGLQSPAPWEAESSVTAAQLTHAMADSKAPLEGRLFALEQLAALDDPVRLEALLTLQSRVRGPWIADYVRCLARAGAEGLARLDKFLEKRHGAEVRAEAVYGRARYDAASGEAFAREILRDSREDEPLRVAALAALADRGSPFARVEALRRLGFAEGAMLLKSLQILRADPSLEDAPYLIDLLERGSGRASNEAVRLLRELTNYRIGNDPRSWRYWLLRHKTAGTPFYREKQPGEEEPTTISYMGIPILGEKIIFVLDSSGSMQEPLLERSEETKASRAVEELVRLLPQLPFRALFNLVFFDSDVSLFEPRMVPRDGKHLDEAVRWLRANRFEGSTNLYGGILTAMDRAEVEEIIVLSDGEPTTGELTDPARILARVARWNRFRMVRINAISLGAPRAARDFLCKLARTNDGICRVIN